MGWVGWELIETQIAGPFPHPEFRVQCIVSLLSNLFPGAAPGGQRPHFGNLFSRTFPFAFLCIFWMLQQIQIHEALYFLNVFELFSYSYLEQYIHLICHI